MSDYFTLSKELFESASFKRLSADAKVLLVRAISIADESGTIRNLHSSMKGWDICSNVKENLINEKYIEHTEPLVYIIPNFEYLEKGTSIAKKRNTFSNLKWRKKIMERDGWKCQSCGSNKRLHAHHKLSFSQNPEHRLDISNGITLCRDCHLEAHGGSWHNV